MSQEYYAVEKNTNLGALNIGVQVFETIVLDTIEKIKGVKLDGNGGLSMPGAKGPVAVKVNKSNQVSADIEVLVDYGMNVTTLSTTIQTEISNAIMEMTGLKNAKINVLIKGINF